MYIYGHNTELNYLSNLKNLSNAYLFFGPSSIGKKMIAINFSLFINSLSKDLREINNNLVNKVKANKILDIRYIEGEENNIKIDNIREIIEFSYISNHNLKYKIFILNNAENLTIQAQQSILKILEEPPEKTIFILITNNLLSILPTIISRSQIIKFNNLNKKEKELIIKNNFYNFKNFQEITNNDLTILTYLKNINISIEDLNIIYNSIKEIKKLKFEDNIFNLIKLKNKYNHKELDKYILLMHANYIYNNKNKFKFISFIKLAKLIDNKLKEFNLNNSIILSSYLTQLYFILKTKE